MPNFPFKLPALSTHLTRGNAIARARALANALPQARQNAAMEVIAGLDLPEALKVRLQELHRIEEN